jgi:glycosyltransferase involved in cell wall biosynthesis
MSGSTGAPLRVCFFGTYRAGYTRNQLVLDGLRRQGVSVQLCHEPLWRGIEDRVAQASGGWRNPRFWWRVVQAYWALWRKHRLLPDYDVMLLGYPGQFDAFLGRLLSWARRKPMVLDILMSLHLVATERGLVARAPWTGRLIFLLERLGLRLPDLLISENWAYEGYYCRQYGLSPQRFRRVPHGADTRVYHPRPVQPPADQILVTYHGTFVPSHGLETIVAAAVQLTDRTDITFHFYGDGPERAGAEAFTRERGLTNAVFHGFVDREELLDGLARAHVCLGVFGTTLQSHYTIQNKVWEGLAMGRPVISGFSDVVAEALTHGEHIYLVERANPDALAAAIRKLADDPVFRERLATNGHARFLAHNANEAIGAQMLAALRSVVAT